MLGYERYLRLILHGWHARRERDLTRKKPMAFFALELFVGWNNKALRVFLSPPHLLNISPFGSFALKHDRQGLRGDVLRTGPIINQGGGGERE